MTTARGWEEACSPGREPVYIRRLNKHRCREIEKLGKQ